MTHSHVRDRNARQPARNSASVLARDATSTGLTRIMARKPALATNVPASIASPHPAPIVATITPANAGPSTAATLPLSAISAFACCRSAAWTVWGTTAVEAGPKNASAAP